MGLKKIWRTLVKGEAAGGGAGAPVREEPLECVIKEQKRSEHLQNLGMKRNKSIRKSIAKKLKRRDKAGESDTTSVTDSVRDRPDGPRREPRVPQQPDLQVETRTSIGAKIEGGRKVEVIAVEGRRESASLVGDAQPLPSHIQNDVPRKMDKIRRSFRHSMRKRKESAVELSKAQKWSMDEAAVRAGTCQYYVKYLGCCEVFESRGMQVCEAAVASLREQRRRTVRGTLYVSGDSIRVVDDDTKGLILDQTIEKVSFCAPDRNVEKGFSYICRDGTTRRWMCHAFLSVGDSGERLSHAVGCAFGICLENKQKRDTAPTKVSVNYNDKESSFTRLGTFRSPGASLANRLADPQAGKCGELPVVAEQEQSGAAVERPRPPELMYQRQASFRGLGQLAGNSPFKRGSRGSASLRPGDLTPARDRAAGLLTESDTILEDLELPPSGLEQQVEPGQVDLLSRSSPSPPAPALLQPVKLHRTASPAESETNPFDCVPDQPGQPLPQPGLWLNSLNVATDKSNMFDFQFDNKLGPAGGASLQAELPKSAATSSGYNSPTSTNSDTAMAVMGDTDTGLANIELSNIQHSILEYTVNDPFDADWAAIATRNSSTMVESPALPALPAPATNPFIQQTETVTAFELQL